MLAARYARPASGTASAIDGVERHSPADRVDPVRLDAPHDQREPGDAAQRVAEPRPSRSRRAPPARSQRARRRGARPPREPPTAARPPRVSSATLRVAARQELRELVAPNAVTSRSGTANTASASGEARELAREPLLGARRRELREHRQPDRLGGDPDDDEDAVGRQEPVRLVRAAELLRDHDSDDRGDARDEEHRRRRQRATPERAESGRPCTLAHRRGSVRAMSNDTLWTAETLDDLKQEFGDVYDGRTVLVTGADGFMGSHLTDGLVELGANVHAFVRATSSGALNNISHLRDRLKIHFADLTDRTSVDYLVKELRQAADKPYVFHLGAQAHVGESWHRPYETVAANVLGTLNLLQAIVDWELEVEKFDTAGTSEEYGNVRESVTDHHDFDDLGVADPARALADQPEVDLRDLEGRRRLPDDELPRRVRRPRRRHADVQQLRAKAEPALRDRHDHHAGADARDGRARQPRSAARLLLLHGRRPRPPHGRGAGNARRRLRLRPGREHQHAGLGRAHPQGRNGERLLARRPSDRDERLARAAGVERGHGAPGRAREADARRPAGSRA